MIEETYYTIVEAATILKIHPQTLRRWIRQGKLPVNQIGNQRRLRQTDLEHISRSAVPLEPTDASSFEQIALAGLSDLWENAEDAIYDNWRTLYNVADQ